MSTETIKIAGTGHGLPSTLQRQDLARLQFAHHDAPAPAMSIWMMSMAAGQPAFPWWSYGAEVDADIHRLAQMTGITTAQGLFEFFFMLQLKKAFPNGLYVIVPGNVRTDGWSNLPERAQSVFQKGQSCVYRLDATFGKRMSVNWVPFYQPQCLVKDPSADVMMRFFNASKTDDPATSVSFFTMKDVRRFPEVVNLLIRKEDKRSELLAKFVDVFGVFSSPRDDRNGTCALAYAADAAALEPLKAVERVFSGAVEQVRTMLLREPTPATALKVISRLIVL